MKQIFDMFLVMFSFISCNLVVSLETYLYEKQNFFGLGRRLIPNPDTVLNIVNRRNEPEAVLSPIEPEVETTIKTTKDPNDTRVFKKNPNENLFKNMKNREQFPETLPSTTYISRGTFRSLYQGFRSENDSRIFRRRFEHVANVQGQQIICEGLFNCTISFLALESTEAIPVLLRGGAGYKYFTAIVKSKPGRELKGQVRAYCKLQEDKKNKNLHEMVKLQN